MLCQLMNDRLLFTCLISGKVSRLSLVCRLSMVCRFVSPGCGVLSFPILKQSSSSEISWLEEVASFTPISSSSNCLVSRGAIFETLATALNSFLLAMKPFLRVLLGFRSLAGFAQVVLMAIDLIETRSGKTLTLYLKISSLAVFLRLLFPESPFVVFFLLDKLVDD